MILYTGGKTGGHIIPLVSLIDNKDESIYVGYSGYLEEKICKENNITFIGLDSKNGKLTNIFKGIVFLFKRLKKLKIKAVVSTGGFVSAPLIFYAILKRIPIYLLEENLIMGKFNQYIYPFASKIFLAHPLPKMKKKFIHTGIPMKDITVSNKNEKYDVLIIGGSLGSKPLCDIAYSVSKNYKTLLIAGRYYNEYKEDYNLKIIEFSNDIYNLIQNSKIVISRCGAVATYEVMYLNKPLIVVPSEKTKRNHQVINAKYFDDNGLALMVKEDELKDNLIEKINNIMTNVDLKIEMTIRQRLYIKKDSKERIRRIINEL